MNRSKGKKRITDVAKTSFNWFASIVLVLSMTPLQAFAVGDGVDEPENGVAVEQQLAENGTTVPGDGESEAPEAPEAASEVVTEVVEPTVWKIGRAHV